MSVLNIGSDSNNKALFILRRADLQSTADQFFTRNGDFTNYQVTQIVVLGKTGGVTVACAGGIYTAVSKGGTAIVATAQVYTAVSAANKVLSATLAALTDVLTATPIFSLTTGSTAAATADIFIFGYTLD